MGPTCKISLISSGSPPLFSSSRFLFFAQVHRHCPTPCHRPMRSTTDASSPSPPDLGAAGRPPPLPEPNTARRSQSPPLTLPAIEPSTTSQPSLPNSTTGLGSQHTLSPTQLASHGPRRRPLCPASAWPVTSGRFRFFVTDIEPCL
jgi:hypothetical protein